MSSPTSQATMDASDGRVIRKRKHSLGNLASGLLSPAAAHHRMLLAGFFPTSSRFPPPLCALRAFLRGRSKDYGRILRSVGIRHVVPIVLNIPYTIILTIFVYNTSPVSAEHVCSHTCGFVLLSPR
jgi:hypothetical protein